MEAKTRQMMQWVAARLKEPSTWRGILYACVATGITVSPELSQAIISIGMGIASVILIITEEKTKE